MELELVVQVGSHDREVVAELARDLGQPQEPAITHPFDGEVVAQVAVALTGGGLAVLRTWIRARVDQRQHFKIVRDGVELSGYNAREADRLMASLDAEFQADGSVDDTDDPAIAD